MITHKTIVWTLTILSFSQLTLSLSFHTPLKFNRYLISSEFDVRVSQNDLDNQLSYVTCAKMPFGHRSWSCFVYLNFMNYRGYHLPDPSADKTCNVTFLATKENTFIFDWLKVYQLSANKLLLVWYEENDRQSEHWMKFTIVSMNDCHTSQAEVQIVRNHAKNDKSFFNNDIILYNDDTFDFVYKSPKVCKDKYCKVTIDANGKTVKGPVNWLPLIPRINALTTAAPYSSSKGIVAFLEDGSVKLINNDESKELKKFTRQNDLVNINVKMLWSNEYNAITVCGYTFEAATLNCTQYDQTGKTKFVANLKTESDFYPIGVHNLKAGGFALVNTNYPLYKEYSNPHLYVRRITETGQIMEKNLITSDTDSMNKVDGLLKSGIHGKDQDCVIVSTVAYKDDSESAKLVNIHKCYNDENFLY